MTTDPNSPGRKRQTEGLRKAPRARGPRRKRSIDIDVFCLKFLEHNCKVNATIRALNIGTRTAYQFFHNPKFDEHMESARKKIVDKAAEVVAKRIILDRSHLDERLLRQLDKHRTHETRGDQDFYMGTKIGYQSLGLIEAPKVINNATAQAGAQAGSNAFEVYEPQWLREKKAEWGKQLEAKHGIPLELSTQS